jgi:hypothetical protein
MNPECEGDVTDSALSALATALAHPPVRTMRPDVELDAESLIAVVAL